MEINRRQSAISYYHRLRPGGDLHDPEAFEQEAEAAISVMEQSPRHPLQALDAETARAHSLLYGAWASSAEILLVEVAEAVNDRAFIDQRTNEALRSMHKKPYGTKDGVLPPPRLIASTALRTAFSSYARGNPEAIKRDAHNKLFHAFDDTRPQEDSTVHFTERLIQGAGTFASLGAAFCDSLLPEARNSGYAVARSRLVGSPVLARISRAAHLGEVRRLDDMLFVDPNSGAAPGSVDLRGTASAVLKPGLIAAVDLRGTSRYELTCPVTELTDASAGVRLGETPPTQPHIGCPFSFLPAGVKQQAMEAAVTFTEAARQTAQGSQAQ